MTLTTPMPTLPDRSVLDRMLEKVRIRMFFVEAKGISWIAALVCSHAYVWDETCGTAWCNGTKIGLDPRFFLSLDWDARITVVAHEAAHTMYDHFDRIGDRDPDLWNQAADYVINNELHNMGFSFKGLEFACLDHQYDGMTTEQVYDLLLKLPTPCAGSTKPMMSGDIRQPEANSKPERITKMVEAKQAAQAANEAGSIPGEIQAVIEKLLNPKLPWHVLLERFLIERNQDDYSWKRPNRRHDDIYLPSMLSDNGLTHLLYFFDVSGSVTDEQTAACLSNLIALHKDLQPERITLITFDTKIQGEWDFYREDLIEQIEITGRGGTSLAPVYERIVKERPSAAIIFSDLYCEPMENPGVPIIWIVLDRPDEPKPDFGVAVQLATEELE